MSDTIFVLGAGGFIGRHLAEALAASGREVIAATRQPAHFADRRIRNVVAAFDREQDFLPHLEPCDVVVHAASISTPGSSAAQPQLEGNLRTTLALVEALQTHARCRLLYLSSGGTLYGDRPHAAREDDPLRPRSYHGAGKAAAEHFANAWAEQFGGTAILLRPSNVYGPGQPPRPGFGIIPAAFECALSGTPLTILGDGRSVRDYLYVDDLVALCVSAASKVLPPGAHVYNAARGLAVPLNELLDQIDATTRKPLQRIHQAERRIDIRQIVPDPGAARATFGWEPRTDLTHGLAQTWEWFRKRT